MSDGEATAFEMVEPEEDYGYADQAANGNRLNPLVGRPHDRLVKVIVYALWGEIAGPCPTDTAHALDEWRETALRAYQHDNGFHMKVNVVASHALDAARAFCTPNRTLDGSHPDKKCGEQG